MRALLMLIIITVMPGCNRTDSITRFGEEHKMDRQYYVYPSTLRMANLKQDEEFYKLIGDFEKGEFYSLSNTPENSDLVNQLKNDMIKEGFEEAMMYNARDRDVTVYVRERKVPKIAAILETDSTYNIIQIEGLINITKIPKLIKYFDKADYLNVLEIIQTPQKEHNVEHHPEN
jgi:hypothetical protein